MALIVSLVVLALVVGFFAVGRNQKRLAELRSETVSLEVDALGVRRELADGRTEEVHWDELREVEVVTADKGPHGASGGVVVLSGDEVRGCLVPIDRVGPTGLIDHLGRLPGFAVDRFVAALEARPPARITCWASSDT